MFPTTSEVLSQNPIFPFSSMVLLFDIYLIFLNYSFYSSEYSTLIDIWPDEAYNDWCINEEARDGHN